MLLCPNRSLKHSVINGRQPYFGVFSYRCLGCKSGNQPKKELLFTKWRMPSEPHSQHQCFLFNLRMCFPCLQQQKGWLPTGLPFCTTDNWLLRGQKDLALYREEIGCFTQTNVTSQDPPDSFIQLTATGWKNNCMSNRCVVDLVRCKQKNIVLVMLPSVIFSSK